METKLIFTYQTKNLINGKTYIGVHSTYNIHDGYIGCGVISQAYAEASKRHGLKSAFIRAVCKYGYNNFKREILCIFDSEEEAFLVDKDWVDSQDNYNVALGGKGGDLHLKLLNDSQERKVFELYMQGKSYKELCSIFNVSRAVIYKTTKRWDTSQRVKPLNSRQKENAAWISEHGEYYRQLYIRGIKSKREINQEIPVDLYKSKLLEGLQQIPKYFLLLGSEQKGFSTTKELRKLIGEDSHLSGVNYAISNKTTYKNLNFIKNEYYGKEIK